MKKYTNEENQQFREELTATMNEDTILWMQDRMQEYKTLMTYYRCAMMEIETKFRVLDEELSAKNRRNPIVSIKTRLKTLDSIRKKLEKQGNPITLDSVVENINDVAGVRVVCTFESDVYEIVSSLIMQDDVTIISKKDYIKEPKTNGYRSLHLVVSIPIFLAKEKREVKVEIQLRTIAMDIWASLEHEICYKKENEIPFELRKELYECSNLSALLDERMNSIYRRSVERSYIIKPKKAKQITI